MDSWDDPASAGNNFPEGGSIPKSPAVVLGISELDPVGAQLGGEVDDLPYPVEVGPVQHHVHRKSKSQLPHQCGRDLFVLD